MIFFDTETCGLHGPVVLIQWAKDDGPIFMHNVWNETIESTIELIESFVNDDEGICGFNLAFDWFHLCQLYTTLIQFKDWEVCPVDHIDQYADNEILARDGPCLKPKHCLDLMLHARKGPYQSTMDRGDIEVKRVPTALAWELQKELDKRVVLKNVYFARKEDKKKRWEVVDIFDDFGDVIPDFKNLKLRFAPSSALKALAADALGVDTETIRIFSDVEPSWHPTELGYAPFAKAISSKVKYWTVSTDICEKGGVAWPGGIKHHIDHWEYNLAAREYANDDVKYTRMLYEYFGKPPVDDVDSILACMVGAVRWRGFKINVDKLKALREKAIAGLAALKFNFNSAAVCKKYLEQVMGETERLVLRDGDRISTKALILEEIATWTNDVICDKCEGMGCTEGSNPDCHEGLKKTDIPHPAAARAQEILDARHAQKRVELYDKLILAGRFHASFKVIGTLSSRMAGADGLNAQGIAHEETIRECFDLAPDGMILCGGDFDAFEVSIMVAVYKDPVMMSELQSGKKIHALFGECLFAPKTYDEIVASSKLPVGPLNMYDRAKKGVFALAYFGEAYTLSTRVGIPIERAEEGYQAFIDKYKVFGEGRKGITERFCSMKQAGGIGTKVEWNPPADYIESLFGFRRYFTLENQICKVLFDLAESPPKGWMGLKLKVTRRDREQSACGAVRSALFAAAFGIQSSSMRAAGNHLIQSTGAEITKKVEAEIWEEQPTGVNAWRVMPFNVHDEIQCPCVSDVIEAVKQRVVTTVETFRATIPLIGISWKVGIANWAGK